MSRDRLAHVLRIIAVDAVMFVGAMIVLVDVASHAETKPPTPMFGGLSVCGVLVFAASLIARIVLRPPTRD